MRNLIFIFFILLYIKSVKAQYSIGITYGFDHISIGKQNNVNWKITDAASLKFSAMYQINKFNIGCFALMGKYNLNRPNFVYEQEYTSIGLSISKELSIIKKLNIDIRVSPYIRIFDTEFYSASMIIDSYNFGLRVDTDLKYHIGKKFCLISGYSLDKDILRSAIISNEITNKDRFINMLVNSFKVGVIFELGNQSNPI